jgi:broad specificity phosphatase PhoE
MIVFARHGQTELNQSGRLQGRIDAPLSEVGQEQAAALGARFASEPVQRVLSSPLRRARDTAAAIATPHALPVEVDDRLIELDYGDWDGVALADVPAVDWATWHSDRDFAPPGGERLPDVTQRIASLLTELAASAGDALVVAVSHVSPIKAAVCRALDVDELASWHMHLGVAAVTRIGFRADGAPYLISFNEPG